MLRKHFLQSKYWAGVRESQGHQVVWIDDALMTVKSVPGPLKAFGYLPQVNLSELNWEQLAKEGRALKLSHVLLDSNDRMSSYVPPENVMRMVVQPTEGVFYRATLEIDLSKPEETLLAEMHKKHRYNIRVAGKHEVEFEMRDDPEALTIFLNLFFDTVKRQKYFGRTPEYYRQIWKVLQPEGRVKIAIATYSNKPLTAWMIFLGDDTVYYPYGGSSDQDRNVMAANGLVWGLIKWAKSSGYRYLDLWGIDPAGSPERENMHGFTRFKLGFGGEEVNYLSSYVLIIDPLGYWLFKFGNSIRWLLLNLRKAIYR